MKNSMADDEWDIYAMVDYDIALEDVAKSGDKMRHGYNTELAIQVCMAIATDPRPYEKILKSNPHFPDTTTIGRWRVFYPVFAKNYTAAKKAQAQIFVDEIIDIIDDPANCEPEILNWAKSRVSTRQWLATKLLPKIYGDRQQNDVIVKHEDSLKDLA